MGQKWILVKEVVGWLVYASKTPFHLDYSMHCDWIWEKKERLLESSMYEMYAALVAET